MTISTVQVSHLPSMAFEYRKDLPPVPALYFVVDGQLNIAYIGQTANLRDRWKQHHRGLQMERGSYRIHWREVADEQQRLDFERQAIKYFRPPWNRSEVPVADMKRVTAYINDVARYMEIDPRDLVARILTEWAYNRKEG